MFLYRKLSHGAWWLLGFADQGQENLNNQGQPNPVEKKAYMMEINGDNTFHPNCAI